MTCFVNCALFRTLEAKPDHRAVRSISLHETLTDHVSKAEWWVAVFHAGIRLHPRLVVVGQAYTLMLVSRHDRKTEQTNRKTHASIQGSLLISEVGDNEVDRQWPLHVCISVCLFQLLCFHLSVM